MLKGGISISPLCSDSRILRGNTSSKSAVDRARSAKLRRRFAGPDDRPGRITDDRRLGHIFQDGIGQPAFGEDVFVALLLTQVRTNMEMIIPDRSPRN